MMKKVWVCNGGFQRGHGKKGRNGDIESCFALKKKTSLFCSFAQKKTHQNCQNGKKSPTLKILHPEPQ